MEMLFILLCNYDEKYFDYVLRNYDVAPWA